MNPLSYLLGRKKNLFIPLGPESRFFVLLKHLNLYKKMNIQFVDAIKQHEQYFIPIEIPHIESLADKGVIIDQDILDLFHHNPNVNLLYDLSIEAILFSDYTADVFSQFHHILKQHRLDPNRIFLLSANACGQKHYSTWAKANHLADYQIHLLGYHFYLYEYFWEIHTCGWMQKKQNILMASALNTINNGHLRKKHFLCLNLRPRRHRTAILLHLLERGYLEKGYVTYFGDDFADHDSVDKINDRIDFIERLESKTRLLSSMSQLKKITPLLLDKDASLIRKDLWQRKPGQVDFLL